MDILTGNPVAHFSEEHTFSKGIAKAVENQCARYLSKQLKPEQNIPFVGAAIGFASYSGAARTQGIKRLSNIAMETASAQDKTLFGSSTHSDPKQVPALYIGIYQWIIALDHENRNCTLLADPKLTNTDWHELCALFTRLEKKPAPQHYANFSLRSDWVCQTSKKAYAEQFHNVKNYIAAGDTYQINLSREFSADYSGDSWAAYLRLRSNIPAPFSGYVKTPNFSIASFSPERFIQIRQGQVKTQPIKGTRARKSSFSDDQSSIENLLRSEKDRAENLMIVDLMRNDIGKHCKIGSVKVPKLFEVQSFSNVHHLVSTISGELESHGVYDSLNCLLDCLPGGSITGAPKFRAMQIIDELETHDRSIYCGSLLYVTADGDLDSNILIRSLLFTHDEANERSAERGSTAGNESTHDQEAASAKKALNEGVNRVYCWGGGGLVADSQLETEYDESFYKISHILDALSCID